MFMVHLKEFQRRWYWHNWM